MDGQTNKTLGNIYMDHNPIVILVFHEYRMKLKFSHIHQGLNVIHIELAAENPPVHVVC